MPQFVQLEDRSVPATFVVTNILDSVTDQGGGLSLRQAILAANNNPGHDDIVFNIPISPSLPTLPNDPTVQYFPIILATTLPDLTDPQGVTIDATTQPRVDVTSTRPLVQLLPNPNKGAFPNEIGAFNVSGQNNVIRGFVITGFPGSAINLVGVNAKNNMILGNWINTDITGTLSWNKDPIILQARPPGTPDELTNAGPVPNSGDAKHVISGITLIGGASNNIIGGTTDAAGVPLVDGGGRLIGAGGSIIRFNNANPPGGIPITMDINRNVISGTPEYRKDFILAPDGGGRERDLTGAAVGPGIRIMDPGTSKNLVQGNFIGTDVTGEKAIPNHNGIEIFNGAFSNIIGNPLTPDSANLIRFNVHDGVRIGETPNPSKTDFRPNPTPRGEAGDFVVPIFYDHYSPNYFIGGVAGGGISIVDLGATAPRRDSAGNFKNLSGIDPDDYGASPTTVRGAEVQVGTTLTLRGRNLLGTTAVSFFATEDGTSLVQGKFKIIDDATVQVTVPEGAVTGTIQVSSAGGVFPPSGTINNALQVVILPTPQPILENTSTFTPSSGTTGQLVTISGKNFGGTLQVLFNGQPTSKFTVLDVGTPSERIEAFVPLDATTGPITIQNPAGSDVTVRNFVVVTEPPPSIDNLLTTSGVPGQEIILSGSGFTSMSLVRFGVVNGSSGFATADFTIDSPTQVRVRVPANANPVLGQIQVTTAGGTALSPQSFQILPAAVPSVTSLSTNNAVVGTTITITGTNLQSTLQVLVGGVASPRVRILDNNTITAVIPQLSQGAYQLVVQSLGGSATPQGFTVAPSPFPTVDPISGVFRNSQVVITGTGLLGTSKILFGDPRDGFGVRVTQFEVLSNTQIRMTIPVGASSGPFFVFTPGGQASNAATILASGVPNISEAALPNPVSGIVGSVVQLQGNGLIGTQDVFFPAIAGGMIPAASFKVVSDTLVTAVVPAGAKTGGIQIQVPSRLTGGARQTVTSAPFTVLASQGPILNQISTTSGPIGTFVTLTGSGFTGAQQVVVGGIPQTDFTVLSDNQIQFRIPNLAQDGSIAVVTAAGVATNGLALAGILPAPGTLITVTGTGFSGATSVTIGGVAVGSLNIVADTRITFTMPAGATNGTIVVTKPTGSPAAMGTTF
ncbi:MAG: IPT/TIG domain-containing protein, partial [Planctomycetia bacterium]|nr:IPT/TIG domain-containing protein [Planctomycetia bacterium]